MKVAVPEWQGRVSPVFDVATCVVVTAVEPQTTESDQQTEDFDNLTLHERVERLANLGVDVLICGAISRPLEALLTTAGVRVVRLVCGPIAEVLQAFRNGTLENGQFAMPGCCQRRRQRRGRCRRGGNAL